MHHEHGARGFSFQLEDAPPEVPSLGRLELDWSDLGSPRPAPEAEPVAPAAARPAPEEPPPGQGTPLMPHAAAGRTAPGSRPLLQAFVQPAASDTSKGAAGEIEGAKVSSKDSKAEDATRPCDGSASPAVRRLSFPTAGTSLKASPRPSTRFADSIGQRRVQSDSSGDLRLEPSEREATADASPPQDLPERTAKASPAGERTEANAPGQPAVLLRQANTLWLSAKDTAADLGGRGLDSGRLLAAQMSDALRERLERKPSTLAEAPSPATSPSESAPSPSRLTSPLTERRPSTWMRQSAGPMLALVAAGGMFMASRQLLAGGGVELSHNAPAIPDLGDVGSKAGETPVPGSGQAGPTTATAAPSGPPPAMVTEVVPLPAGMAWPGKGLLEVVTSEDELVYVDGVFTGRGPLRRVPVTPGAHEISIRKEGSERHGTADVEPGRTTRALFQRK